MSADTQSGDTNKTLTGMSQINNEAGTPPEAKYFPWISIPKGNTQTQVKPGSRAGLKATNSAGGPGGSVGTNVPS